MGNLIIQIMFSLFLKQLRGHEMQVTRARNAGYVLQILYLLLLVLPTQVSIYTFLHFLPICHYAKNMTCILHFLPICSQTVYRYFRKFTFDFDKSGKVIAKYFSCATKRQAIHFSKDPTYCICSKNNTHSLRNTESTEWAGNVVSRHGHVRMI